MLARERSPLMTPDLQFRPDLEPFAEAERLLSEALRVLDGTEAHLAAAYAATALDALARFVAQQTGNLH